MPDGPQTEFPRNLQLFNHELQSRNQSRQYLKRSIIVTAPVPNVTNFVTRLNVTTHALTVHSLPNLLLPYARREIPHVWPLPIGFGQDRCAWLLDSACTQQLPVRWLARLRTLKTRRARWLSRSSSFSAWHKTVLIRKPAAHASAA